MGALVLKSESPYSQDVERLYKQYELRVRADGGKINSPESVKDALNFVIDNSIDPYDVKVATSMKWGVKEVTGRPNVIYSLFGSDGDLLIDSQDANRNYTALSDDGVLSFRCGSTKNKNNIRGIKSRGVFDVFGATTSVSVVKGYESTGAIGAGGKICSALSEDDNNTYTKVHIEIAYAHSEPEPSSWNVYVRSHSTQGSISTAISGSEWNTYTYYINQGVSKVLSSSGVVLEDANNSPIYVPKTSLRFYVTATGNTANLLRGYWSEAWFIDNMSEQNAINLSAYLESKYPQ